MSDEKPEKEVRTTEQREAERYLEGKDSKPVDMRSVQRRADRYLESVRYAGPRRAKRSR